MTGICKKIFECILMQENIFVIQLLFHSKSAVGNWTALAEVQAWHSAKNWVGSCSSSKSGRLSVTSLVKKYAIIQMNATDTDWRACEKLACLIIFWNLSFMSYCGWRVVFTPNADCLLKLGLYHKIHTNQAVEDLNTVYSIGTFRLKGP